MGVDSRKAPPLPAPTETDSTTAGTEIESRVTEKTTYSLPSDGSPVTIPTKKRDKGLSTSKSQTSFLIEYFEGGKGSQAESRRPSVRVKVTPSSKSNKSRSPNDHIQITERKGTRKPSYTKRIQLSPTVTSGDKVIEGDGDDHSIGSYRSATEESNVTSRGGGPIEVEIMPRRHGSPLIPATESNARFVQQTASDISSMPADSFLDGKTRSPERKRSRSLTRGEALAAGAATGLAAAAVADKLRTPSRRRSRSLSRERLVAQKAVEKVRGEASERRRKHSSRSRSVSGEQLAGVKSPRRRSSRSHHDESLISGTDPSLLNSQLSKKSGDQYSFRSGTSKSSINNPKLLETVEDAIRRLILPELTALKREQSKHAHRDRDRRGSFSTTSALSKDSREETSTARRLSDRGSSTDISTKPKVTLNDQEVILGQTTKDRRDRNLDRVRLEDSPGYHFDRETSEDTVTQDGSSRRERNSDKHRVLGDAAIAVGAGALTAAVLHEHQSKDSLDEKKERRRRRIKSRSRSDGLGESHEEREQQSLPPMPLMSDINASEVTRSSILSAETERPRSASQEHMVTPLREVPRGFVSPASQTPTRTPIGLQQGLGTQHSNYSRGNLSLHSQNSEQQLRGQEYEVDEHGRKVTVSGEEYDDPYVNEEHHGGYGPMLAAGLAGAAAGLGLAAVHHHNEHHEDPGLMEDEYDYYQNHQEVPPPLRYVPYGHERRGLSPIQSVSGYTEGDPELPHRVSQLTQSTGSYSSPGKSAQHKQSGRSIRSLDSNDRVQTRHDFREVRQGGLTDSELTQEGEIWEDQRMENNRDRDLDAESYRSSDPRMNYKHMTNYTDESMDAPELDRVDAGQNVRGVGANPDYVHTPFAVESVVASLVNESDFTTGSGLDHRGSYASYEDGSDRHFTSRGNSNSPAKRGAGLNHQYAASDREGASQRDGAKMFAEEYDVDDQGRKVTMPKYKNSHAMDNAGLAGIAAGAAAAVLADHHKQKSEADQIHYEAVSERTGAPLHKSFKERALESQSQIPPSPHHSIDAPISDIDSPEELKMGASGLPDASHPIPEIGQFYDDNESEVITNPSVVNEPMGEVQDVNRDHWPGHPTPPSKQELDPSLPDHSQHYADMKVADAALVGAAVAAARGTTLAGHSRDVSQDDEWQRTSGERKRDTLVTNPYEGTSPVAPIGGGLDRELLEQNSFQGANNDFEASKLGYAASPGALPKDEGYISSAPNARSVGGITPVPRTKGVGFLDEKIGGVADALGGGDPFYSPNSPKHSRHLSGMSHGMSSPIYDSATGYGIDRIQSKDIVALMDHLTVRDAQRSARDTEMLVTLVQAGAEMRNSFEHMKRLLADTEDVIITEVQGNTDRSVQKVINGPRPLPQSNSRSLQQRSQEEMYEDIPAKRRNVFRRALKGLSLRSSNDLGKIEDMLVQLLGEVEGLKAAQGLKPSSHRIASYGDLEQEGNFENDGGYEPEGNAGTSTASHASQSGHFSVPRVNSAQRGGFDGRMFSDHRISTVPEGNEDEVEIDHHEQVILNNQFENNELLLTPTREVTRGGSVPLGTPPQQPPVTASLSNENTPRTDKSKKHKSSSSSSWIPKVSRWSDTTTSTILKGFRSSGRKSGRKENDQFTEPQSRSGSDLGNYADNADRHDPYGDDKLDMGYSQDQLQHYNEAEPRSLLPPEDPKYKAHRNSLNLQHPQPRPGPTHRYQTALESQASNFDAPTSPKSVDFGSQLSLDRLPPQQQNRFSDTTNNTGNMSPTSDGAYSQGLQAPARPPKEPIPPEIPPKIRKLQKPSPLSNGHLNPDHYGSGNGGSPRYAPRSLSGALSGPTRKPTGPRSMSSTSKSGDLNIEDVSVRRKNRDTFGTVESNHSGESETF